MQPRTVAHGSGRVRLVVETDDPAVAICDFATFVDAGFDVVVCGGPGEGTLCPALAGQPCAAVEASDVVFNAFRDQRQRRNVARVVHETSPDVAIVVSAPSASEEDLPDGCVRVSDLTSVPGQIAALRHAAFSLRRSP
jgi:hypothetical protein